MRFFTRSARPVRKNHTVEQSKNAVLHSLGAASSQESYGHAIDEFIGWYCSEPRLAFNRTVVLRYWRIDAAYGRATSISQPDCSEFVTDSRFFPLSSCSVQDQLLL